MHNVVSVSAKVAEVLNGLTNRAKSVALTVLSHHHNRFSAFSVLFTSYTNRHAMVKVKTQLLLFTYSCMYLQISPLLNVQTAYRINVKLMILG